MEDEKKRTEEKQPLLALEVYGITCDESSCGKRFDPQDIFICTNINCKEDFGTYCRECGAWKHRSKKHSFDPKESWIKCMADFLKPDEDEYSKAKATSKILVEVQAVEKFLWHHRWSLGIVSKALSSGSVTIGSLAVNGHMTIAVACGLGRSVIAHGLIAGAVGGGVGAAVSTILESGFIWYKYGKGQLSLREALELTGVSLASNAVSAAAFFGVMAIGAAFGVPGGPIGVAVTTTIGAVVAAILFGFGTRCFLNHKLKKKFQNKHEAEIKLQKEALKYFFNDEKYPIDDENKFNKKILRKRYHRFCLITHPDKNGGKENQEWLKLCAYYGILIGIWEKKHDKETKITNSDDINEEQRALIVKNTLKCAIYQTENNDENLSNISKVKANIVNERVESAMCNDKKKKEQEVHEWTEKQLIDWLNNLNVIPTRSRNKIINGIYEYKINASDFYLCENGQEIAETFDVDTAIGTFVYSQIHNDGNLMLTLPTNSMDNETNKLIYSVEEILSDYDTLKIKFRFEASRSIKRSLKQSNKGLSKTKYLKITSKILFNILCESHKSMQTQKSDKGYMDSKSLKEKAQTIALKCAKIEIDEQKLDVVLHKDAMNKVLVYAIECLTICWKIVMSRDPPLKLVPLIFEPKATIIFDDAIHEAGPRSETIENLNFVIWPSIVRTDTSQHLRKIIAVFLNDIPLWSKAKLKRMKKETGINNDDEKLQIDNLNFKANAKKSKEREFPALYDIITHYQILKTEHHVNASMSIKRSLKKYKKNLSKAKYLQIVSKVLLDILCKSYESIQTLKNEQFTKIVQQTAYNIMLQKIEKEAATIVLEKCIKNAEFDGILSQDAKDKTLLYSKECLKMCCEIVLSFDALKLEPLTFASDGMVMFDEDIYEEGPRSELGQCLNFIIWPSIIRIDTNERLSKIIGVFLNKIPEWSNAKRKEIKM